MKASKSKYINISYFLDERKLIELESILKEVSNEIEYSAYCTDGTYIDFSNLEELISYPNKKENQYKKITIRNDYNSLISISLSFSDSEFSPIYFTISGEGRTVENYSRKIEDFLMSLKKWYSFLALPTFWFYLVIILAWCTPILLFLNSVLPLHPIHLVAISASTGLLIFYLYYELKKYIFPVASFELGDGIDRAKSGDRVRTVVLVSALFALAIVYIVLMFDLLGP